MDIPKKGLQTIDLEKLNKYFGDDRQTLIEFMELFISQSKEYVETFTESVRNKNFEEVTKQAHKLKATYANLGINTAYELLSQIEYLDNKSEKYNELLKLFFEFKNIHIQAEIEALQIIDSNK
jgi:HPt (histidine-containing phosphotransfer) domain-containing protein